MVNIESKYNYQESHDDSESSNFDYHQTEPFQGSTIQPTLFSQDEFEEGVTKNHVYNCNHSQLADHDSATAGLISIDCLLSDGAGGSYLNSARLALPPSST